MKYRLATETWNQKEYAAIQKVIKSGNFTMGHYVKKFEDKCAKQFNSKYCVMVNSGSSANLLMIASLFFKKNNPLKYGDEVIVPSVSWSTTYAPLQQYGLKVKFIDIDINTLNLCTKSLKKAISKKTKMIFAVNLLGNPNNFYEIKKIIKNRDIYLIEDNCESLGSKFDNKYSGNFGLMGSHSSFFSHHISTMEGGFILTKNKELYQILLSLRAHGWTRNLPRRNIITGLKSRNEFNESFKFVLPGYNVRPLEMSGAIGIEQLDKVNSIVKSRRKNAALFKKIASKFSWLKTQEEIHISSWFGFAIILKESVNRENLIKFLTKNNIETRPIVSGDFTKNKKLLSYFKYSIYGNLENSKYIDKHGFFIGNSQENLSKEIMGLEKVLLRFEKIYNIK